MYAYELIGRLAIRTAPANGDYSWNIDPIKILSADETHITCTLPRYNDKLHDLDSHWCDNNWKPFIIKPSDKYSYQWIPKGDSRRVKSVTGIDNICEE